MAETVIDVLETIEIEEQDRHLLGITGRYLYRLVDTIDEQVLVRQAGKFVMICQVLQASFCFFFLFDDILEMKVDIDQVSCTLLDLVLEF